MAYNRIHNRGEGQRDERVAAATISPGMVLEVTSAAKVQAHSTEGGRAERIVALEDALQGNTVDDNYSADDVVQIEIMKPGDTYNLLIAAGQALNPGEEVISAGNGTLIATDAISSGVSLSQVIGRISPDEAAFTTLSANTLKAVRIV